MAAVELLEGQIHVPGRSRATTVSLFCGGGGETAGKVEAFRELGIDIAGTRSLAVNHWDLACLAHKRNYPWIPVKREDITQVTAADFGLKTINLLWASPSCVHHSRARGGRPKSDQQRAHAWEVLDRWLKVASVDVLLIENVPEFVEWGPLHDTHSAGCDGEADVCLDGCHFNTPIRARRGESFQAFLAELREMGYEVDWRLICAADYGDATIRQRFFLQAVRDGRPIRWPEPTHQNPKGKGIVLDPRLLPWRWGAECIDWSLPLCSIFADRTEAKAWAKQNGYKQPPRRPLADKTMARIAQGVDRFVLKGEPFIAPIQATGGRNEEKVAAFIAKHYGGVVGIRPDQPLGTVTSVDHHALVAASLIRTDMHKSNAGCAYPLDEPLRTVTTAGGHALVAAFLTKYHGNGGQWQSLRDPLHAVTTKDEFSLITVEIDGYSYVVNDICMRMLRPHELAAAMGFPSWYRFELEDGTPLDEDDQVRMIGNACPVHTVKAIIKAVVLERPEAFGLVEAAS